IEVPFLECHYGQRKLTIGGLVSTQADKRLELLRQCHRSARADQTVAAQRGKDRDQGGARDVVDRASALRVGNRALAAADDLLPAHRQARPADVTFLPQPSSINDWYRLRNIPHDE